MGRQYSSRTVFRPNRSSLAVLLLVVMMTLPKISMGFSAGLSPPTAARPSTTSLAASASGGTPNQADFEYRELNIQLNAMKEQNVVTSQLMPEKRIELEGYVKRILNRRPSPVPMYEVGKNLPGTQWRLAFSTQSLVSDLPKDARISLHFLNDNMMNYNLEFTKTLGLNKLTARSSYSVDVSKRKESCIALTRKRN